MKLDLLLVLEQGIVEVLADQARLLEELEVKALNFESQGDVELSSFLIRAL